MRPLVRRAETRLLSPTFIRGSSRAEEKETVLREAAVVGEDVTVGSPYRPESATPYPEVPLPVG